MSNTATMKVFPPKDYTAEEIRRIREERGMTQTLFAYVIGVSRKTVESWEYGKGKPSGAARRLITIMEIDPECFVKHGVVNNFTSS